MDDTIKEIQQVGQEASAQISAATQAYIAMGHPKPNRVKVNLWHIITMFGLDMVFQFIALLGAAYISANRIGILMEIAQANLIAKFNQSNVVVNLGGSQGTFRIMSMMAFEGALIAAGLYAGGKMKEKEQDPWAERVAFAVTMVGGFMSTITLQQGAGAERIAYYTGWIFSIITAVAASVVVRFTAKNMGFLWNAILNLQETFDNKWKNLLNEWQKGFEDYFPDFKQQNYGKQFQRRLSKGEAPTPGDTNNPKPQKSENDKDISDRLRRAINKAGLMPKEIGDGLRASPAAIADLAKLSKEERKNLHAILNRFRGQQDRGVWDSSIGVNDPVDEEEVNINQ